MIEIKTVDKTYADSVSDIIQKSFKKQSEILNITKEKFPNYVAFETPEMVVDRINNINEFIVLAYLSKEPIGSIRYNVDKIEKTKGYINRLAVLPEYRGKNYGKLLMEFAENKLKFLGANIIEISIVANFENLKNYYINLGYTILELKKITSLPFDVLYLNKYV